MTSHRTDPPAYAKAPNQSPIDTRKRAQDLMHAAENPGPDPTNPKDDPCGSHCCAQGTIRAASITVNTASPANLVQVPHTLGNAVPAVSLLIPLPNSMGEGISVTSNAFTVRRGDAKVELYRDESNDADRQWRLGSYRHEGMTADPGHVVPYLQDFFAAAHPSVAEAVAAAESWIDAMDAWYSAIEQAKATVRGLAGVGSRS